MKIGIIDIGSNSIRTMTAASTSGQLSFSEKQVYTTRLAEGLFSTGILSDVRMEQSLAVVSQFAEEMQLAGIPVYAYATSAVRDAKNRDAFAVQVRAILGDRLAILSGEQEAHYAYIAATGEKGAMIDIGGGSTQLVNASSAVSVPIGCVRAKDICKGDACLSDIKAVLIPSLADAFPLDVFRGISEWSGVGGTITTLAAYAQNCRAYDKRVVANTMLSRQTLCNVLNALDRIPLAKRAEIPLLSRRYDVILHGGTILYFLMESLSVSQIRVSDADGMEGYAAWLLHQ